MQNPEISPLVPALAAAQDGKAWWRHPMLWLVIGGPAAVVLASLATAVVAVRGADPVLSRDESGAAAQVKAGTDALTPAMLARNHAATPKATAP